MWLFSMNTYTHTHTNFLFIFYDFSLYRMDTEEELRLLLNTPQPRNKWKSNIIIVEKIYKVENDKSIRHGDWCLSLKTSVSQIFLFKFRKLTAWGHNLIIKNVLQPLKSELMNTYFLLRTSTSSFKIGWIVCVRVKRMRGRVVASARNNNNNIPVGMNMYEQSIYIEIASENYENLYCDDITATKKKGKRER